jgi:hypothetical protein
MVAPTVVNTKTDLPNFTIPLSQSPAERSREAKLSEKLQGLWTLDAGADKGEQITSPSGSLRDRDTLSKSRRGLGPSSTSQKLELRLGEVVRCRFPLLDSNIRLGPF